MIDNDKRAQVFVNAIENCAIPFYLITHSLGNGIEVRIILHCFPLKNLDLA